MPFSDIDYQAYQAGNYRSGGGFSRQFTHFSLRLQPFLKPNLHESNGKNRHRAHLPPLRKLQPHHHRDRQHQDVKINGCIDGTRDNRKGLGPDTDLTPEARRIDASHFGYNLKNGEGKTAKGCEGDAKQDEEAHRVADFKESVKEKEDGEFDKEDGHHVGQAKGIEDLRKWVSGFFLETGGADAVGRYVRRGRSGDWCRLDWPRLGPIRA